MYFWRDSKLRFSEIFCFFLFIYPTTTATIIIMEPLAEKLIEDRVLFPSDLVGRFVGRGGKNIKILQARHTDVSIRVSNNTEGDYTPIILQGKNKIQVKSAKDEIKNDRSRFIQEQQPTETIKLCRFGNDCNRKKCSFLHPNFKENLMNAASQTEKRRNTNKPKRRVKDESLM